MVRLPCGLHMSAPSDETEHSRVRFNADEDARTSVPNEDIYRQPWYCTFLQILIPFFMAGIGTITAGIMLGNVQYWTVYREMSELIVLVPAMCGLKGNLDMCVASRFSTHSNLGNLQQGRDIRQILVGNVAVVQVQAIVCSMLLATLTAIISSTIAQTLMFQNFTTLAAAALITASTSCMILDTLLMVVILFSQRYKFNPDYMATPIVASIGDVVSIGVLSFSAAVMYDLGKSGKWVTIVVMLLYLALLLPFWVAVALHNSYTKRVLKIGWVPVLGALCINQMGGFVLSSSVDQFEGFAVFSPIINGVGGNLVSVQASNMGSLLYQFAIIGTLPPNARICESPVRVFCYGTMYSRVSRILIIISIPGNIVLVCSADYLYKSHISVTLIFMLGYLCASLLQLLFLLWVAHSLIHLLWKWKLDPDSSAIPYLTAIGDTLGTALLAVTFHLLRAMGHEYQAKRRPWLKFNYPAATTKLGGT